MWTHSEAFLTVKGLCDIPYIRYEIWKELSTLEGTLTASIWEPHGLKFLPFLTISRRVDDQQKYVQYSKYLLPAKVIFRSCNRRKNK